jgi:RNA polymerase sigma-70 factor (ECF subfamily)
MAGKCANNLETPNTVQGRAMMNQQQFIAGSFADGTEMDASRTELLVRLLAQYQNDLFRYVFALLPNEEDAKDALQETYLALFHKFAEYDPAKPFLAWAYGFAFLEVLKQRERNQRGKRHFSCAVLERLAREREQQEDVLAARLRALDYCLERLPQADRDLIQRRYQERVRIDELVQQLGSSRRTLFRDLERIRRRLFDCISRRMQAEGLS